MTDGVVGANGETARTGALPHRRAGVEAASFDAAFVVFDPHLMQMHLVEGFAAVVFDACDGETSYRALSVEVGEITGMGLGAAMIEIDRALDQLQALGLLEGSTPHEDPPCVGCGTVAAERAGIERTGTERRWWFARRR